MTITLVVPQTMTLPPSRARLGGTVRLGDATHLITAVGAPIRFDDHGWPVEVLVETELCNPQPAMCSFVNGDGLPCLNDAEGAEGRCELHPHSPVVAYKT